MTEDDIDRTDHTPEEEADELPDGPERSATFKLFAWLITNGLLVLAGIGALLLVVVSKGEWSIPRSVHIIGVVAVIVTPLAGRPVARKVRSMLWSPSWIWLVDVDASDPGHGGIYRWPSQQFRQMEIIDGELDWVSPTLAFGKNVDLVNGTIEGTWRGTLSDRELLVALSKVDECRSQLEDDAKRGFAIETQAFTIVRSAARSAVRRIVSTFERGTLPDEGDGITEAIDAAIEDYGLSRSVRKAAEEDKSPTAEVPEVHLDADLRDLANAAAKPNGGVPADD